MKNDLIKIGLIVGSGLLLFNMFSAPKENQSFSNGGSGGLLYIPSTDGSYSASGETSPAPNYFIGDLFGASNTDVVKDTGTNYSADTPTSKKSSSSNSTQEFLNNGGTKIYSGEEGKKQILNTLNTGGTKINGAPITSKKSETPSAANVAVNIAKNPISSFTSSVKNIIGGLFKR